MPLVEEKVKKKAPLWRRSTHQSSNELTAREYVEVWPIVRRVGAWGVVVAPAGKARTTGQVTGTFIGWRREGVEVKWGIEGVFPCQDETTSHRTP